MGNWHRLVILALGLFCAPLAADAGVIYSDFGPANTFLIDSAWETKFVYMATPFVTTGAVALAPAASKARPPAG
jgi:hypothetical protein